METWREVKINPVSGARRLVTEFGDRLYTAAVRVCGNEADAEDLVFRTFDHAVRKIEQYDGRAAFFSWLYAIMFNFWRMDMRRKGANALVFDGELPETEDPRPDPAEELAAQSDHESVRAAIAKLPAQLRAVVVLRYYEDMGMDEMASVLAIPVGTVKHRLFRAKRELAARLSQTFSGHPSSYTGRDPS
ncbi:MAG: RNA polymerase sigma factor [Kiritimatiellae bacterium]|nr:RNA polymerase sigma factor [Kiritimatiellia bacterium]